MNATLPVESATSKPRRDTAAFGLLRRRVCVIPTWRGWLLILLVAIVLAIGVVRSLHPFLAMNDPRRGGILVMEGWTSDYTVELAIREYDTHPYEAFYVTGGPIERGDPLSEYHTLAEAGAATIRVMRPDLRGVQAVPSVKVQRDRTYASAVALKHWLDEHGKPPTKLDLISEGPHGRRSRMMFQSAFGDAVDIGVISFQDSTYDPDRWWAYSQGFRNVVDELIAYCYALFLFRSDR